MRDTSFSIINEKLSWDKDFISKYLIADLKIINNTEYISKYAKDLLHLLANWEVLNESEASSNETIQSIK